MLSTPRTTDRSQTAVALRDRLLEVIVFSMPLLLAGIFFKVSYLRNGGLTLLKASLGLQSVSLLDLARLFASEVVESMLIFPLLLLAVGFLVGARWRQWACFACLEIVLLVGVTAWLVAFFTIGRLPTLELTREFLQAYRSNPDFVAPGATVAVGLLATCALILSLGIAPLVVLRWRRVRALLPQSLAVVAGGLAIVVAPAVILAASSHGLSVYHVGGFQRLFAELLRSDADVLPDATGLSVPALQHMYEEVAFPAGRRPHGEVAVPAAAPGRPAPNVIFIVLETACLRDYPLAGEHMPNVAKLRAHALDATRHYSADPYSMRANFSIYSGVYDLRGPSDFTRYVADASAAPLDALPRLLHDRGYATRYYFPHALWPRRDEEAMLRYLGFEQIELYDFSTEDGRTRPERNAHAERAVFAKALEDLDALHAQGKPFFFAIANSIGHAPYFDIRPADEIARDPNPSREALVGNVAGLMDELIGNLVDKLSALGILDDTILVITGDHGPRNTVDNPAIDTRYSNDETYHVPLLIHYPAAFAQAMTIDTVTSHVDLAPTVLRLMGAQSDGHLHQGMSMFDPAIADRVTFFIGDHYIGSDGLYYDGSFYMVNGLTDAAYRNDRYQFGAKHLLADANDANAVEGRRFLTSSLKRLTEVNWAWISYLRAHPDSWPATPRARGAVHTFLAADDHAGAPVAHADGEGEGGVD